ncbi:hypothetical protein B0G84_6151 [Paraburkholderia sp. BL8N3]|jgi:hypothetical protein|nr:hypothetical protein B0G84_6151 [Paraburkholderia sp. BL8N3]
MRAVARGIELREIGGKRMGPATREIELGPKGWTAMFLMNRSAFLDRSRS